MWRAMPKTRSICATSPATASSQAGVLPGDSRFPRRCFAYIAHRSIDEISVDDLKDEIRTVLMTFEPRLERGTIRARRDTSVTAEQLKLRFIVQADLHCEPLNVPVEFIADVDLDSGGIHINRL
jgi:type VI secretion system protein ImpF